MSSQPQRKLVALGGGGGVSQVLLGARPYFDNLTAAIAVTDTGRSTGIARAVAAMPAPGDVRNTLAALARDPDSLMAQLLQHRFNSPDVPLLNGMAFGNLLLAALTQMSGDFGEAVAITAGMLDTTAHVLPISTVNTQLCAERSDGSIAENELDVRALNQAPLARLYLNPAEAPADPAVLAAIMQADIVVIGPGSFFTSVMANLLFDGVVAALRDTAATVVFVCNTTTQPGQTDGFTIVDHVRHMVTLLGDGVLDIALINRSDQISAERRAAYAADGLHVLEVNAEYVAQIRALGVEAVVDDFAESGEEKRTLWNKQDTIRHDPHLIGLALQKIAAG